MKEPITSFKGSHFFLSNFYSASVTYNGLTFQNNEAAFQAMKCPQQARAFTSLPPNEAKSLGRRISLRSDWEEVKDNIMYEICLAKFQQNPELLALLLATGDAELVEGNTWNDTYWGVCGGKGTNKLGKILMRVREELK